MWEGYDTLTGECCITHVHFSKVRDWVDQDPQYRTMYLRYYRQPDLFELEAT